MYAAIEGKRRLLANLDFLEKFIASEMMPITLQEKKDVAEEIAAEARRLAKVKTGYLQRGIIVVEGVDGSSEIFSQASYSMFVEFGTVKTPAQPFMRPAYHKYGYFARVSKALTKALQDGLI